MPITQEERKYLKNKHKGGKNNSKGAVYESYYTTYQIALFMQKHPNKIESVYFYSQVKETFVDDLLIEEPDSHRTYHQIKNTASLTWKTGKKHLLDYDFKRQIEISKEKEERFKVKLVYSKSDSSVYSIPSELLPATSVEQFPSCTSINQLILSHPPFKDAIQQMYKEDAEDDKLSLVASLILGAWGSLDQEKVSLKKIQDLMDLMSKGYIKIKIDSTVSVSDECRELFNSFNLSFYEDGSTVYWSYNNIKGEKTWSKEIEKKLLESKPIDIWDLIEKMS